MASTESLVFDLLVRDRASEGISKVGRSAEGAAKDTDALTRRLNELSRKSVEARVKLAGDREALAALDKMDARLISLDRRVASPNLRVEGAARAVAEISAVDLELDKLGGKGGTAETATASLGTAAGGLAGPGGMGALIGAGVALSPVIATLGVGLAGFGAAAYGAIAPIEKAAGKTGGLAANMAKLNPEQRALATSILGLGRQYRQFQKELQPEVLGVFNTGIKLAGHLLHDVQPVAAATGKALDGFLGQIDAEFRSRTWQDFFGFMAREAGPDVKLVGDNLVSLMHVLPPLLTQLQPVAEGFLQLTGDILKTAGAIETVTAKAQHGQGNSLWAQLIKGASWLEDHLPRGHETINQLIGDLTSAGGAAGKAGASADKAGGQLGHMGGSAAAAAVKVQSLASQVSALTSAENKALSPLLAYSNALIAQQNDAAKLNTALKASHDRIGLNTDVQRASFSAANTYIQDLLTTASAAVKSHQGIDAQINSIRSALPQLQNVRGGTRLYWQEVSTLVGWLNRLKLIKAITEAIHVSGTGVWTVTPGKIGLPGGSAGGPFAAGGRIPGYGGGDRIPVLVEGGEAIVDKDRTRRFAPVLSAMGVPGFASGGVVGSWPKLPGLGPWAGRELRATESAIGRSVAQALVAGIRSARLNPFAGITGVPGTGAFSASAAVAQAFAKSILWAYGWGQNQFPPLQALWNGESGWRWNALNPGSGAYGIPQALPASKMASAGADWRTNYQTQVRWGLGYIKAVPGYGSPAATYAKWLARSPHWYGDGLDAVISRPTVIGVGERGPERVTVTPGASRGGNTYILNITLPPGSDREQGRRIAGYLWAFANAGGKVP